MDFNGGGFWGGAGQFLNGLFGNSGKPYDKAAQQYQDWTNKGAQVNAPFFNAGAGAIPGYQNWLTGQQDPTKFINDLMGQYNESPYAHNLQTQNINAGNNFASANGLSGSSAMAQQLQQNANNISSGDMNTWLQNVLGINTQYGQGLQNLINTGQNSANSLTNLYSNNGNNMGNAAFGAEKGRQHDQSNLWGGLFNMFF
jgi:hypothetical protein